jgi:hypothetical protein
VIVVDASVAIKWFVTEDDHLVALSVLEQGNLLIAPDLIFSVVRKQVAPIRRHLEAALSELSTENLSDLVALAWLGRGLDGRDWTSLRQSAGQLLGNSPLVHKRYIISLLGYVRQGIDTLAESRQTRSGQADPRTE